MQTVLIVDDNCQNLYYLEVLLKGNGFAVKTASNGVEALATAIAEPPVLIISDILMPVMDGYKLCQEWRSNVILRQIPFIFYTATYTEQKDEELGMSLGANRFVIKPQEPDALMRIIRQVLSESVAGSISKYLTPETEEGELLKEYNEALFRKLEKKMAELEQSNYELQQTLAEQKHLEGQLRQAQKMEAIGRFAGGIAHDFNNLLTVIIGCGSLLRMGIPSGTKQELQMDQILAAADRAKNLTRSLLTFSHKQEMHLNAVNLNTCVSNIEVFLHRIIGEDITIKLSFVKEDILVIADSGHIEQVLMNLASNARDAMPTGGVLSIATDTISMDTTFVRTHGYGTPGEYAVLSVTDSGIGMDADTRQRVFEPFFTTKQAGKGTGLGLSIVYGIVSQHNGYISLYSEPGHGTTFKLYLPLSETTEQLQNEESVMEQLQGGNETLLVVDDEAPVREYLDMLLSELGYTVIQATNGQAAVTLCKESPEIDLVLMDVIMPQKNGSEAAMEIREILNDVPILFTSGYPFDVVQERALISDNDLLLMKPLSPVELAKTIRSVLGRSGSACS